MKTFYKPFLLGAALLFAVSLWADHPVQNNPTPKKGTAVIRSVKDSNGTPQMPGTFIECSYGEGFIQFNIPTGYYSLSVNLYNESETYTSVVTTDNPVMEIPVLQGQYYLQCTADDGRIFTGAISFE